MEFEPKLGSIIEFDAGEDHRLALITGTVGKKKLVLHTADGDEMRTTLDKITFELGSASTDDLEKAQQKLASLSDSVESRRSDVDLNMLWEFVREEDTPMTPSELTEVMFADDEPLTVLAMLRALREDPIYFKARRDGKFEPRPDGQVASLREQREIRREKERRHLAVIESVAEILELPEDERATRIDESMRNHDALRNKIYLLQDFAAFGEDYPRREEAEEFLDDLASHRDRQFKGHVGLKAFHLMVELGLWDEHYNLYLHRFRIDPELPEEVREEARELAEAGWQPEPFRTDLTYLTAVTIDAPHSLDLDDALSCQPTIEGGWELYIHIADPSAVVAEDSALDEEARRRGTTVYLPTGTIPMFPRALSEGELSLLADKLRPALTTKVVFDEDLEIVDSEILITTIRVDRRLSYDEVDEILEQNEAGRIGDLVHNLKYIADQCWTRRLDQGAMSFDLPDRKIVVDDDVDPPEVSVDVHETDTASHALVSELMILNNEMVGRFCTRNSIPAIYRIQEAPDDDLVDEEILAIPEGVARTFAQIRRMKPGDISTAPDLHFGLGIYGYAPASSPIRRYGDLLCQRQIKAFLNDEPLPYDDDAILEVLASVEGASANASTTERETQRYWLLYYLQQRGDEPLEAVVLEHRGNGGTRVSVFLTQCAYRSNATLRSKVPVGAKVRLVVERAHPRHDSLTLRQAPGD